MHAATNGNTASMMALLQAGARPNQADSKGRTALIYAARAEVLVRCGGQVLPASGARDFARDFARDETDLMPAAAMGDAGDVIDLVLAGTDVNQIDVNGWTPLFHAAVNRRTAIVGFLLGRGARFD